MNLRSLIYCTIVSSAVFICACRKGSVDDSPTGRTEGKWQLTQVATDDNGNGILDASEWANVPVNDTDIIIYNKDFSGIEYLNIDTSATTYTFTWSIIADTLQRNLEGHFTDNGYIKELTSSTMVLQYNSTIPVISGKTFQKK